MCLHEKYKEPLILQLMHLEKFFDKECLVDVLDCAYSNNIKGKEYRLLYNLNKRREIKVITSVGETKPEEVIEGLSQGTMESGPLSAASTDSGLMKFFGDSIYEIYYNNVVRLQGIAYQDDIFRASKNSDDAQAGISKLEAMAESKLLNFNEKKSCLVVVGGKKVKEKIEKELDQNPVMLYGKPMLRRKQEKYLGDQFFGNTADSIEATVRKRKGNAILTINDIATIVSDARADSIGGISIAIDIWELAVIPFLLNNAGTWMGIQEKTIELLKEIQKVFLQRILKVKTVAIPLMYWDLGQLLMTNRILKRKLLLIHHLANLEENALSKQVYLQQKENSLPGLVSEMREELVQFDVTLDMMESFSKRGWKNFVDENIKDKNKQDLLKMMKPLKKLNFDEIKNEQCEIKAYMKKLTYNDALFKFRMRGRILRTVKTHFKSDKKFTEDLWSCWDCSSLDTSSHILYKCSKYDDLRQDLDFDDDEEVIKTRKSKQDEEG